MTSILRQCAFGVASAVLLTNAVADASTSFGQLSYNGSPVALTVGTGIGNDGFFMNTSQQSFGELTIGLKALEHSSNNDPARARAPSSFAGGRSWLVLAASGA